MNWSLVFKLEYFRVRCAWLKFVAFRGRCRLCLLCLFCLAGKSLVKSGGKEVGLLSKFSLVVCFSSLGNTLILGSYLIQHDLGNQPPHTEIFLPYPFDLYVPFHVLFQSVSSMFSMFSYDLQHKQLIQHFSRFKGKKKERDPNLALSPSWKCNKSFIKFWCFMNMFHSQSCNWKLSVNHRMKISSVSRGHIYKAELFLYQRGGELNSHCSVHFAFSFFSGLPS